MKILFIGDIIGKFGRKITKDLLPKLKEELAPDFIIVNGENLAHGVGITKKTYDEMVYAGIDLITSGNHVFERKEFLKEIDTCSRLIKPANYPPGVPGEDYMIIENNNHRLGVICLAGRVFMKPMDCPFRTVEPIIKRIKEKTPAVLVDIHAEASSEKMALGFYLEGRVSAVLGTHTHVQTADERVLPKGTAYITDVGMVGAQNSVIGVQKKPIIERFLTLVPTRYEPEEKGPGIFNAVIIEVDPDTGEAKSIRRIFKVL